MKPFTASTLVATATDTIAVIAVTRRVHVVIEREQCVRDETT